MFTRKHVFRDIYPYVCTFKGCSQGTHLFERRHDWFHHERDVHRREWVCSCCRSAKTFGIKASFRDHLKQKNRRIKIWDSQMTVLVDQGERSIESEQPCPLCADKMLPQALQRHLGKHMEQLALFVIPGSVEDDENDDSDEMGEGDNQDKPEDLLDDDSEEPSSTSKTADIPKTEDVANSKTEPNTTADHTEFFELFQYNQPILGFHLLSFTSKH
jgi:hypothetical protein